MALDLTTITPATSPDTKAAPRSWAGKVVLGLIGLTTLGVVGFLWQSDFRPQRLWASPPVVLETLDVLTGPLAVVVVETGTVESASNTTIKCQVEALVGMVGGSTSTTARTGAATAAAPSSANAAPQGDTGGKASADKATAKKAAAKKAAKKAMRKAQSEGSSGGGGGGSSSSSAMKGSTSGSGSTGGADSGSSTKSSKSGGSGMSENTQTAVTERPSIRSFDYEVKPYTSLQTKRAAPAVTKAAGQGGGGGGGGGGNRGGGGGNQEKPGSTRIIMIRNEGESVVAGDVVCQLDSAAFRDAVLAQRIKTDSAKAGMVQAQSVLEVNLIALSEYRDGIYAQDLQLIRQYLSTCRTEEIRAKRNVDWSQEVLDKNFRAPQQHQAEVLSLQRAQIALEVAELMERRLIDSTGPKIIKSLEAKLQANRADALALEAAYGIEADRLKRLEKMVANCTLRAPRDGTVVYSLPPGNGWRPAAPAIMEGATVREGQPIFELPDPKKMRIRAKINESKVGSIHPGQRAVVRIDAFPDRRLVGTVAEVTLIPAPAAGPGSDVRIYFANIAFDTGGFEGLKPGLSAEVSFLIDDRPSITQVPIKAIRWVGQTAFAAISTSADRSAYRWQAVELGAMNTTFAEVVRGLSVGERVVARPESLPAPQVDLPATNPATLQAAGSVSTNPKG